MKSAGSGSLADRGLNRQKKDVQAQLALCSAELSQPGGEVENPGDEHLSSISYKSEGL